MNPPAALAATQSSGGSTSAEAASQTTQRLINDTHTLLANCGVTMSPSKVSRIVRRYDHEVARNGWAFIDYLANTVQMTEAQKRAALADPLIAHIITYPDPVGEQAVNNVLRDRRREVRETA